MTAARPPHHSSAIFSDGEPRRSMRRRALQPGTCPFVPITATACNFPAMERNQAPRVHRHDVLDLCVCARESVRERPSSRDSRDHCRAACQGGLVDGEPFSPQGVVTSSQLYLAKMC
eukprot:scaffold527_cov368-Prasinococcus_capsulatus_cf.AAC.41